MMIGPLSVFGGRPAGRIKTAEISVGEAK